MERNRVHGWPTRPPRSPRSRPTTAARGPAAPAPLVARPAGRRAHRRAAAGRRRRRPPRLRGRRARPARLRRGRRPRLRRRRRRRDRPGPDDRRRHRRRPARRSRPSRSRPPLFPGQFLKFVVAAPDNSRVLYVTAADLGMRRRRASGSCRAAGPRRCSSRSATTSGSPARSGARPAPATPAASPTSCAARSPPTRPAWSCGSSTATARGDRRVLVGTPDNGLGPDLFYGDRPDAAALPDRLRAPALRRRRRRRPARRRPRQRRGRPADRPARQPGRRRRPPRRPASPRRRPAAALLPQAVRPDRPALGQRPDADRQHRHPLVGLRADQHGDGLPLLRRRHRPRPPQPVRRRPGRPAPLGPGARPLRRRQDPRRRALERPGDLGRPGGGAGRRPAGRSSGLQGGPAGSHFLVVTGGGGNQAGNYKIVDSWDGSTYKTLADYINPKKGYLLKWLVVFEGTPPARAAPDAGPREPGRRRLHQPGRRRRLQRAAAGALPVTDAAGRGGRGQGRDRASARRRRDDRGRGAAHDHRRRCARASRRRASGSAS